MAFPRFLKKDGESIVFNSDGELWFFVPEKMYETKLSFSVGDLQNIFGLIPYCLVDKNNKKGNMRILKIPTRFLTKPYQIDKIKDTKLTTDTPKADYRVLRFAKGDKVIVETAVPKDVANVEDFIKLTLVYGNLINIIPYDKIHNYLLENIRINGASYGISAQMFGIVLSECCRSPKDPMIPFRLSKEKSMTAYNIIGAKNISRFVSPYSALITENFNYSVMHATMNDKEVDNPLEKVVVGD